MSKEEIISEIQRTAKENGGIPLGRLRFLKETGIKESDWSGKYWSKWSEAISEAGFTPNEKQGSFSDQHLLEKYAEFVIDLGHLPTSAETKMRARSVSDFPSHNTFARFGSKKELVGHVLEFVKNHPKLSQAYEILAGR